MCLAVADVAGKWDLLSVNDAIQLKHLLYRLVGYSRRNTSQRIKLLVSEFTADS